MIIPRSKSNSARSRSGEAGGARALDVDFSYTHAYLHSFQDNRDQLVTSLVTPPDLDGSLPDEIAVVVPVYMGESCLRELCERLVASLSPITTRFSILLVDDRAPDNVWPLIGELGRGDPRRGIQMSRNFGQHFAITAGLDHARARWYVVMDCDLQDAPEDIPRLYAKAQTGFDVVVGARAKEGHGYVKQHASKLFYAAFNRFAGFRSRLERRQFPHLLRPRRIRFPSHARADALLSREPELYGFRGHRDRPAAPPERSRQI